METFLVLHSSYCTFSEFEISLCAISSLHFDPDHKDFVTFQYPAPLLKMMCLI